MQLSFHQLTKQEQAKAFQPFETVLKKNPEKYWSAELRKLFLGYATQINQAHPNLSAKLYTERDALIKGLLFEILVENNGVLAPVIIAEMGRVVDEFGSHVFTHIHQVHNAQTEAIKKVSPAEEHKLNIPTFIAYLAWVIQTGQAIPLEKIDSSTTGSEVKTEHSTQTRLPSYPSDMGADKPKKIPPQSPGEVVVNQAPVVKPEFDPGQSVEFTWSGESVFVSQQLIIKILVDFGLEKAEAINVASRYFVAHYASAQQLQYDEKLQSGQKYTLLDVRFLKWNSPHRGL